jgi:hypothetical protein
MAVAVVAALSKHTALLSGGSSHHRATLQQLLVPTATNTLAPRNAVTYNDAAWIDASTQTGFEFVHPELSNQAAEAVGVRSLQSLLNANREFCGDLHCPSVISLRTILNAPAALPTARRAAVVEVVYDLLEVADQLRCPQAVLTLDERKPVTVPPVSAHFGYFLFVLTSRGGITTIACQVAKK